MKLLAKIPKDAEAVIVLVGKLGELPHSGLARKKGRHYVSSLSSVFITCKDVNLLVVKSPFKNTELHHYITVVIVKRYISLCALGDECTHN